MGLARGRVQAEGRVRGQAFLAIRNSVETSRRDGRDSFALPLGVRRKLLMKRMFFTWCVAESHCH